MKNKPFPLAFGSLFRRPEKVDPADDPPGPAGAEAFGIAKGSHGVQLLTARVRAELNKFRGLIDPYPGDSSRVEIGGPIIGLLDSEKLTHWVIPHHWIGIPEGGTVISKIFPAKSVKNLVQMLALNQADTLGLVVTDGTTNVYFPGEKVIMNSNLPLPGVIRPVVNGNGLTTEGLRQTVKKYGVAGQGLDSQENKMTLLILQSPIDAIGGIGTSKSLRLKKQIIEDCKRLNRFKVGTGAKGDGFLHTHFCFTPQEMNQYPLIKQLLKKGMPLQTLLELNSTEDMALLRNKNVEAQGADVVRQIASGVVPVIPQENGDVFVGPPRFFSLKGIPADTMRDLSQMLDRALVETNPNEPGPIDVGVLYDYSQMMDQVSLPRGILPDFIGMSDTEEPFIIPSLNFSE